MPDWTYQTLFKSPLAKLGFDRGTALALGAMGRLASIPGGKKLIQWMGHMHPDPRLARELKGIHFTAPVGLGCGIDSQMLASRAFAEFGVGYLEVGPLVDDRCGESAPTEVDFAAETITYPSPAKFLSVAEAVRKLESSGPLPLPIFARLDVTSPDSALEMIHQIQQYVDGYLVPVKVIPRLIALLHQVGSHEKFPILATPILATINVSEWQHVDSRAQFLALLTSNEVAGISVTHGSLRYGKGAFSESLQVVAEIRAEIGNGPILIGAVGVHAPADALDYIEAGADLVQVDSGLVFAGPGLPKRINQALLFLGHSEELRDTATCPPPQQAWFWSFLMGLGMVVGGMLALGIALTRIVMPYDESLVGMLRGDFVRINERLLPFMQHDRVTLAGTMLAIGILYIALAVFGIRRGAHWAYIALVVSAATGFFSFFTFLGFGYFDPFHAFVSVVLLQFLLLTTILDQPTHRSVELPDLWNDWRWRRHQWGQLVFVIHGAALIVAGLVICQIGMTSVFVPEDLEFLRCSERVLREANPMLVPLVAHDRASFGGMLVACGIVTLLAALWSFGHGERWLWWTLLLAGSVAYLSTLGVHWVVGYKSLKHLVPAYAGLTALAFGCWASYPFMVKSDPQLIAEWQHRMNARRSATAAATDNQTLS